MSIRHALLALIAEQPRGVGDIRRAFDERTGHVWPMNVGQVYQTVQRLLRDGAIVGDGTVSAPGPGRAVDTYAVTPAGQAEVDEWWVRPVVPPTDTRDELAMKIALAATSQRNDLAGLILGYRHGVLTELRRSPQPNVTGLDADTLLASKRTYELEATARWLDDVMERVASASSRPSSTHTPTASNEDNDR